MYNYHLIVILINYNDRGEHEWRPNTIITKLLIVLQTTSLSKLENFTAIALTKISRRCAIFVILR